MGMNRFRLKDMTTEQKKTIRRRAETDISAYMETAREISEDVRKNGDEAVLRLSLIHIWMDNGHILIPIFI